MGGGWQTLIGGGGHGGTCAAPRLERLPHAGEATMMLVSPRSYMTHQALLAQPTCGDVKPWHVVGPATTGQEKKGS